MSAYLDRTSGEIIQESIYKKDTLNFLYERPFGKLLRRLIVTRPFFSRLYTRWMYKPKSRYKIPAFIEENGIQTADYLDQEWTSLADFFIRQANPQARPWEPDPQRLPSPVDGRLMVYPIAEDTSIKVKGFEYTIADLIQDPDLAYAYSGGFCLIYRLTMADIHRFYHIDKGTMLAEASPIRGRLHTVGPVSDGRYPVLRENSRHVSILDIENLNTVVQIEVGALTVGSIINHDQRHFDRGDEKGYFQPGGSTLIQLIQADRIEIDADILQASQADIETKVHIGEAIATYKQEIIKKGEANKHAKKN